MKKPIDFINEQSIVAARTQVLLVWVILLVCACLAPWYNTWLEFLLIGLPAAAVPTLLFKTMPEKRMTHVSIGLSFMVLAALIIHQGHGMIELHFGIFVFLAFLLFFRDWLPIVAAAGLIAVHHLSFNYLQSENYNIFVFPTKSGIDLVLIHAAFVVIETAVLVYMAFVLRREAIEGAETKTVAQYLVIRDGKIPLDFTEKDSNNYFGNNFGPFFSTLKAAIDSVRHGSDALANSSQEVAAGNSSLALKTDEQSLALAAMVEGVRQISDAVSLNADYAIKAEGLASGASNKAMEGVNVVENAVGAMSEISSSSNSLVSFIETIEEIAFQTNLLALNASIEAAHAGEQGRGFAVVAEEVRSLAKRSSEASKQSRDLIETSLGKVQKGSELVDNAGTTLKAICDSFEALSALVTQMAQEGKKQQSGIQEVNLSVDNMQGLNQSNAALVKQVALASGSMKANANGLMDQVSLFQLR